MSARISVIATIRAESRFGPDGMSLLRLGGVSSGKLPRWFQRIVSRDFSGRFSAKWYDHPARAGYSLVVEPFELNGESLREFLAFADRGQREH